MFLVGGGGVCKPAVHSDNGDACMHSPPLRLSLPSERASERERSGGGELLLG